MPEVTLESLTQRVVELEAKLKSINEQPQESDWRNLVGMMEDNEFTRDWIWETERLREENRQAAREGRGEDVA